MGENTHRERHTEYILIYTPNWDWGRGSTSLSSGPVGQYLECKSSISGPVRQRRYNFLTRPSKVGKRFYIFIVNFLYKR